VLRLRCFRVFAGFVGFAILPWLALPPAFALTRGAVTASEMQGFGRLIFTFDGQVAAQIRTNNNVLILDFDQPITLDADKLAVQVPRYIGIARLDPGGRSMRIGLNDRFRADLKLAGERVFLDLLNPRWQGLPPGLPQDVIDELVRRARAAEARAERAQVERKVERGLELRVAHAPRFRRAIFTMPRTAPVDFQEKNGTLSITFDADFEIADTVVRSQLAGLVERVDVFPGPSSLTIALKPAEGFRVRGFREDDSFTLDFARADGQALAELPPASGATRQPQPPTANPAPALAAGEPQLPRGQAQPAPVQPETLIPPASTQAIDLRIERGQDPAGFALRLGGLADQPVAILQRGPALLVLIETAQNPGAPMIPAELRQHLDGFNLTRIPGAVVLRFEPKQEGQFWLMKDKNELVIQRGKEGNAREAFAGKPIRLQRVFDPQGRDALEAEFEGGGRLFAVEDPLSGGRLMIVPQPAAAFATPKAQNFAEFQVERTLSGLAVLPLDDAMTMTRRDTGVLLSHEIRLNLSTLPPPEPAARTDRRALLVEPDVYERLAREPLRLIERQLMRQAAEAPRINRSAARFRLAQAYLAHGSYPEAEGVLTVLAQDDNKAGAQKNVLFSRAFAAAMMGRLVEATRFLAEPQLAQEPEQKLLQAIVDAKSLRHAQAVAGFRQAKDALDRYPDRLQAQFRPMAVLAAIEAQDSAFAREQLTAYEQIDSSHRNPALQQVMAGRLAELDGRSLEAFNAYSMAARSPDRRIEAEARFGRATAGLDAQKLTPEEAKAEFETLTAIWRRSEVEVKSLARLGEIYAQEGRWREAFLASQRATALMPNHPITRSMEEAMGRRFESIFLDQQETKLSKVEALAIHQEFRTLVPPGRRGDEIARRLADRLADLDLVNEATDILEHQVKHRLDGLARAVVATRLGVMHLQNRQPVKALTILNETRLAGLPPDLRRARTLVEARSLGELFRTDLAIEVLANETGDDVDRLRADIHWKGKQWREAGEAYEKVLGESWQSREALSDQQRLDVLRAGLAYVLAEETLSLDRLRSKFLPKMAESIDAGAFNLIAMDSLTNPRGFRDAARQVVNADTLTEFLASYRKRYPEISGESRPVRSANDPQRQSNAPNAPTQPGRS
jgi:tetratricopeptide (TPR) repeat protein